MWEEREGEAAHKEFRDLKEMRQEGKKGSGMKIIPEHSLPTL